MRQKLHTDPKPAIVPSRALPSADLTIKRIVDEKPDAKVVKEYFRKRIEELELLEEMETK